MNKWVFIITGLLIVSGGGWFVYKARGLRNNNPGNIRHGSNWQGMADVQTDDQFVQFHSPVYGIRAMNRILRTYATKYDLHTVRGIISRWAPANENNTEAYVQAVANRLGVDPDERIDVRERAADLTRAIIKHENGLQPYGDNVIAMGVEFGWA